MTFHYFFKNIFQITNIPIVYLYNNYRIKKLQKSSSLFIVIVPADNIVNGGVLSIVSFIKTINHLEKNINIIAVTSRYKYYNNINRYNKFNNNLHIFHIKDIIKKYSNLNKVKFFIPDVLITPFINKYENEWSVVDKKWLKSINTIEINILNQNQLLMPSLDEINKLRTLFTNNITMTMAHKKSVSIENRLFYNMPIHYLSAWINESAEYEIEKYRNKENLILFSPDDIHRANLTTNLEVFDFINKIKLLLPNYKIIIIKNIKYENYKILIKRAKFMITFGEGFDGYFVETILSGGISFATYNKTFFTPDYLSYENIFPSFENMYVNIVDKIKKIDNEMYYINLSNILKSKINQDYNYDIYCHRVQNYLNKNFDIK
jgi:hypothetical protein